MEILTKTALMLFGIVASVVAPELGPVSDVSGMKGKALPAFTMTTTEGKKLTNADLKGKVAVIDFWATWCGPCKEATPFMQSLHARHAAQGLVVIGANGLEDADGAKPAADYKKKNNLGYVMTHSNDALMSAWGVRGVPTFLFVDRKGVVREVFVGYDKRMDAKLNKLTADLLKESR